MIEFEKLVEIVSAEFQVDPAKMVCKTRLMEFVKPRWLAMTIYSEVHSLNYTAKKFGKNSHQTVMHGRQRTRMLVETDPDFRQKAINVMKKVKELSCYPSESIQIDPADPAKP
jgi:chromosomal replication initiation ATPase DnaA